MADGRLATASITSSNQWTQLYQVPSGKTTVANLNIVNVDSSSAKMSVIITSASYTASSTTPTPPGATVGFTLTEVFDVNKYLETVVMTNASGSVAVTKPYVLGQYDCYNSSSLGYTPILYKEIVVPGSASFSPFMPNAPLSTSRKEHVALGQNGMVFYSTFPRVSQSLATLNDYWYWNYKDRNSVPLPTTVSGSYMRLEYINGTFFVLTNAAAYAVRESDWTSYVLAPGQFTDMDYNPATNTYAFVGVSASLSTVFTSSITTASLVFPTGPGPTYKQASSSGVYYSIQYVAPSAMWFVGMTNGIMSSSNLVNWASASISGAANIVADKSGSTLLAYLPTRDVALYTPANSASINVISVSNNSGSSWQTYQPSGSNGYVTDAVEVNGVFYYTAGNKLFYYDSLLTTGSKFVNGPEFDIQKSGSNYASGSGNISLTKLGIALDTVSQSVAIHSPAGNFIGTGSNNSAEYGMRGYYGAIAFAQYTSSMPSSSIISNLPFSYYPKYPFAYSSSVSNVQLHGAMLVASGSPNIRQVNGLLKAGAGAVVVARPFRMFDILTPNPYVPTGSGTYNNENYNYDEGGYQIMYRNGLDYSANGIGYANNSIVTSPFFLDQPYRVPAKTGRYSTLNEYDNIIRFKQWDQFVDSYGSPYISCMIIDKSIYSSSTFLSTVPSASMTCSVIGIKDPYNSNYPLQTLTQYNNGTYAANHIATSASGVNKDSIFD